MKRLSSSLSFALTSLVLLAVALPAGAQDIVRTAVPFKAVVKGPTVDPVAVTPVFPPIAHFFQFFTGDSDTLGKLSYADHHPVQLDLDGKLLGVVNGAGSIKTA